MSGFCILTCTSGGATKSMLHEKSTYTTGDKMLKYVLILRHFGVICALSQQMCIVAITDSTVHQDRLS